MSVCHWCGGVYGRDCFNPQECKQISRSMADQFPQASQDVAELFAECDKLKAEVGKLRALLLGVLENDEAQEGFNSSNLGEEMKQQIRDAIVWKI